MKNLILSLALCLTVSSQAIAQRFFQKRSTWHEKIPASPRIVEHSDDYVNDVIINNSVLTINYHGWSVPVWYARENTPYQVVPTSDSRPAQYGWNNVPIPPEAMPASKSDGHMVVISHDRKYEWDFYQARKSSDGTWRATIIRRWDLSSDGINSPYDLKGSCRVAPIPLTHGLIMFEEIQRGYIDHAIAFAYWGQKMPDVGVYPCEKNNGGINPRPWALSLGFRLQLDPDVDIDALGLNPASKIIAKALQEYGMVFVENCGPGCNSVYAESLDDKEQSWQGLFDGTITNLPLNKFRIVEPIYPNENKELEAVIHASIDNGKAPLVVAFTSEVTGGASPYNYLWGFGDGNSSNMQNPTHTFASYGRYRTVLTVRDNEGRQATDSVSINVSETTNSLSIIDIKFTQIDGSEEIKILKKDQWYDLYLYFNTPPVDWSEIAFADVWINTPFYTYGDASNRGGKYYSGDSYIMSFSISSPGIWARQTEGSMEWHNVSGTSALYVDDDNNEYELNATEGWAKARVRLLPAADVGVWFVNVYVKSNSGFMSNLYSEIFSVQPKAGAPIAFITHEPASPIGNGPLTIHLTTSKDVVSLPALLFTTSTYQTVEINLEGQVPGNSFQGVLIVDENISEGMAKFTFPPDALTDSDGNQGNDILSDRYVWIDKTPPTRPKVLSGSLTQE